MSNEQELNVSLSCPGDRAECLRLVTWSVSVSNSERYAYHRDSTDPHGYNTRNGSIAETTTPWP